MDTTSRLDEMRGAIMGNFPRLRTAVGVCVLAIAPLMVSHLKGADDPTSKIGETTVAQIRDAMMIPHFFKIQGIARELADSGASLPPSMGMQVHYVNRVADQKRLDYANNEDALMGFDMAYSEGRMETSYGEWDPELLSVYVNHVLGMDQRFVDVAEASALYLQDAGISKEDASSYVRQSIAISFMDHVAVGRARITEDDPRLLLASKGHGPIVMDLHAKIHNFFQDRLDALEVSGGAFIVQDGEDLSFARNVVEPEPEPEMEM